MQKLVHRKSKTGKLQEFQENSRNLRKTQAFSEKTQGFANSTWFSLQKNVQKISLQCASLGAEIPRHNHKQLVQTLQYFYSDPWLWKVNRIELSQGGVRPWGQSQPTSSSPLGQSLYPSQIFLMFSTSKYFRQGQLFSSELSEIAKIKEVNRKLS